MDHHPVESIGRARRNRYRDERFRLRVGFDFRDGTSTGVPRRQTHVLGATEEQFPTDQKERGELDLVSCISLHGVIKFSPRFNLARAHNS